MIGDGELDQTVAQLAQVQQDHIKQHQTLSDVLEKYGTLIEDYKRLKSDFEEERDSRERYKQMARGSERNPFVLVLVDGDGYIFDDNFVLSKEDGGQRAAQALDNAVKASLRSKGLEHCRVMVRIYANLVGLSKALSRSKLSGPEKRSLAPFVANFNRSNDLFDFVDAGELKENADFKLRSMWRLFVENSQCKHIFFAGCHDVGYINELTPYQSNRDKISLVRTYAFHQEFNKLGMQVEDFPGVFRQMPLDAGAAFSAASAPKPVQPQPQTLAYKAPTTTTESANAKVCYFYQKGKCTYGQGCKNLHVKAANGNSQFATAPKTKGPQSSNDWRQTTSSSDTTFTSNPDSDFMRGTGSQMPPAPTLADYITNLPRPEQILPGTVAINKDDHRLDPYFAYTTEDRAIFTQRVNTQKLCNRWHLTGFCPNDSCPFDHNPVSDGVRNYLRSVTASQPCPRRGDCRSANCLNGHVCQKGSDCQRRGGKAWCKFPEPFHRVDLAVTGYVDATGKDQHGDRDDSASPMPTESEADGKSANGESRSFFSMPFGRSRSGTQDKVAMHDSSDDDDNGGGRNGAKLSPAEEELD